MTETALSSAAQSVETSFTSQELPEASDALQSEDGEGLESSNTEDTPEKKSVDLNQKYRLKINGVSETKTLGEILKDYQKFQGANKRFQEAAELRKQYEQKAEEFEVKEQAHQKLIDTLRYVQQNPKSLFELGESLGINVDDIAHEYVLEKMKYSMMPEDERNFYEEKKAFEKEKSEIERYKKLKEKEQSEKLKQEANTRLESEIVSYFELSKTKPDLPVLTRAVDLMLGALDANTSLPFEKAYAAALKQLYPDTKRQQILAEALEKNELTPEQIKRIRQQDIQNLKNKPAVPSRRTDASSIRSSSRSAGLKPMSIDEWFSQQDKRYR